MEINTNVTSAVAASISKLNLNTARRAFETTNSEKEDKNQSIEEKRLADENIAEKLSVDVEDIQKYAKYMGENLSIDDINYGLMYGRSVIADYSI